MIIYVHVIVLCMLCYCVKKFEDFDTFLASNDWPTLLKKVEEEYLTPQKVVGLYQGESEEGVAEVVRCLLIRKHEFEVDCIDAQAEGHGLSICLIGRLLKLKSKKK